METKINEFEAIKAGGANLTPITPEQADEMLCVLPPIYAAGCFAVGEEADHTPQGVPVWYCAGQIRKKWFGFFGTIAEAEAAFAKGREI